MKKLITMALASTGMISAAECEKTLSYIPEEIINTRIISDVQLSPSHNTVLFVATQPHMVESKKVSVSRIYKISPDTQKEALPFTAADVSSLQPRWSPDGRWIAFTSNRDAIKNLYLIAADGGEAIPLTKEKKDIQTFCWSPDGQKIAFVMSDETEVKKSQKTISPGFVYQEEVNVNRLYIVEVFSTEKELKALTSDSYCVRGAADFGSSNVEFDWSPDSKKIIFAYSPTACFDSLHLDSSLAVIDLEFGETTAWKKEALIEAMPRFSPDGQWIGYVSSHSAQRYSIDRQLAISAVDGKNRRLLSNTFNEGAFLAGPNLLGWTKDARHLIFFEPRETKFHLMQVPIDGTAAHSIDIGQAFIKEPALSADKTMIGFTMQSTDTAPEAFIAKLDDFKPVQVSKLNSSFQSFPKIKTTIASWSSNDGMKVDGLLTYPLNYQEGKRYPLLVVIHGGPMAFFDETFIGSPYPYPIASFAEAGFMVLRPNPRGSCGYGKKFRCANYSDWGGGDLEDILSGVDHVVNMGLADPERLGIMGWSYGGYMTAWAITQTHRFKAASVGAGACNLVSLNGTTDLYRFLTDCLGDYTEKRNLYETRSPINYIQNVKTPCLIQHGIDDKRTPVSQAYEYYHALKRAGKNTKLVLYPGMEHRPTDPNMMLDIMEQNLAWFKQYLLE